MYCQQWKRREFITLMGRIAASPLLRPQPAHAQQGERMARIGVLMPGRIARADEVIE